ncbi:hypothetical protein [Pedobacter sp. SL55]|uniref:hypothetical protein n=1 Tax=Pedobacter sp. SL55 TaxID=2995161 RepID=UPI002270E46E|nr:hypothetical protein [Pedobacter sp. SL55]WAC39581.1 hypothetical protein OVA16_13425 [Pedobacter sp. SL55]
MEENKQNYHNDTKMSESKHPEPTEEVQLTIETVTPDTHQSLPKAPVADENAEEKVGSASDSEEAKDEMEEVNVKSTETEEYMSQAKNEQEETDNDENIASEKSTENNEGDDERDKIETIAP